MCGRESPTSSMPLMRLACCVLGGLLVAGCGEDAVIKAKLTTSDAALSGQDGGVLADDDAAESTDAGSDSDAQEDADSGQAQPADTGPVADSGSPEDVAADVQAPADAADINDDTAVSDAADAEADTAADVPAPDVTVADTTIADSVPTDASAPDVATSDVKADAGVKDTYLPPTPLGPLTHPLQTVDEVRHLLTLHQVVGSGIRQVIDRQYQNGNATCPGLLAKTGATYTDKFINACTVKKADYAVDVFGDWTLAYTDACQNTAHHLYNLTTGGVTLQGKDNVAFVDLAFDKNVAVNVDTNGGDLAYTWAGKSTWKKLPTAWLPTTAPLLAGHIVGGIKVQRAGTKTGGTKFTGWLELDGQGAQFDTPKPLKWLAIPQCFVPTEGQLRLEGSAVVVITFAPGSTCAPATWTRDGVAMGNIETTFWSWLVVCGSGG